MSLQTQAEFCSPIAQREEGYLLAQVYFQYSQSNSPNTGNKSLLFHGLLENIDICGSNHRLKAQFELTVILTSPILQLSSLWSNILIENSINNLHNWKPGIESTKTFF